MRFSLSVAQSNFEESQREKLSNDQSVFTKEYLVRSGGFWSRTSLSEGLIERASFNQICISNFISIPLDWAQLLQPLKPLWRKCFKVSWCSVFVDSTHLFQKTTSTSLNIRSRSLEWFQLGTMWRRLSKFVGLELWTAAIESSSRWSTRLKRIFLNWPSNLHSRLLKHLWWSIFDDASLVKHS